MLHLGGEFSTTVLLFSIRFFYASTFEERDNLNIRLGKKVKIFLFCMYFGIIFFPFLSLALTFGDGDRFHFYEFVPIVRYNLLLSTTI